jgi:hypothetical protein
LSTTAVSTCGETRVLKHRFEFRLAEAKPLVGVHLARLFKAMLEQVEHHHAAAGPRIRAASASARSGCSA